MACVVQRSYGRSFFDETFRSDAPRKATRILPSCDFTFKHPEVATTSLRNAVLHLQQPNPRYSGRQVEGYILSYGNENRFRRVSALAAQRCIHRGMTPHLGLMASDSTSSRLYMADLHHDSSDLASPPDSNSCTGPEKTASKVSTRIQSSISDF